MTSLARRKRDPRIAAADRVSRIPRIAFYVRVSTEEQASRHTPRNQVDYLQQRFAANFADDSYEPMIFAGTYSDEGVSGVIPFSERPQGAKLLAAIRAHEVDIVVFLKLDRFGREIRVIYEGFAEIEAAGGAVMSATEGWETRTPQGKLLLGILAVLAAFERDQINERTSMGRDRIARDHQHVNGVLPFGYELQDRKLVPSTAWVVQLGMSEADVARLIFKKVAAGLNSEEICDWLNASGVPSSKVWVNKDGERTATRNSEAWRGHRVTRMIHRKTYYGHRVLEHASGPIDQIVEPLIDRALWQKAQDAMSNLRFVPADGDKYIYLLTGKIFCGDCGSVMTGNYQKRVKKNDVMYYACRRRPGKTSAKIHGPCNGFGYANGFLLEEWTLETIDGFMLKPEQTLDELRRRMRERQGQAAAQDDMVQRIHANLRRLEGKKAEVLSFARKDLITTEDAEGQLFEISNEMMIMRQELERVDNQAVLAESLESRLLNVGRMLQESTERWFRARRENDRPVLRDLVQGMLSYIKVQPDGHVDMRFLPGTSAATETLNLSNPSAAKAYFDLYAPVADGVSVQRVIAPRQVLAAPLAR